jgi:hypothetical protein
MIFLRTWMSFPKFFKTTGRFKQNKTQTKLKLKNYYYGSRMYPARNSPELRF